MSKELPPSPSIESLKKQAKHLLEMHRAHDVASADLFAAHHPSLTSLGTAAILQRSLKLCDAQLTIARQYGFSSWPKMMAHLASLGILESQHKPNVDSSRIADPEYRARLAARRGFAPIGTLGTSRHGVQYKVVDHLFALSIIGVSQAVDNEVKPRLDEFQPCITIENMSSRLQEFYAETDCCTSRALIFFDSAPALRPGQAAPNVHSVIETQDPRCFTLHFDTDHLHETIIAHELGHIWIALVENCEDYRYNKDYSDLGKVAQFQHLQSFVLDLKVNDVIEKRGFDMSIISNDQFEGIRGIAEQCSRGAVPRTIRAAAAMAHGIAAIILEQRRQPAQRLPELQSSLARIEKSMPGVFRLAQGFVTSVKKHGYDDASSVQSVIDECAVLSFQATGDDFDLDRDLIEIPSKEWMHDKDPEFLRGLPVPVKLKVRRAMARHGIWHPFRWELGVKVSGHTDIRIVDLSEHPKEPLSLTFQIPELRQSLLAPPQHVGPEHLSQSEKYRQFTFPAIAPSSPFQIEAAQPSTSLFPAARQPEVFDPRQFPHRGPRHYMPGVAIWMSRVGFAPGAMEGETYDILEHPYSYAENNPLSMVDPTGLSPCCNDIIKICCGPSNPGPVWPPPPIVIAPRPPTQKQIHCFNVMNSPPPNGTIGSGESDYLLFPWSRCAAANYWCHTNFACPPPPQPPPPTWWDCSTGKSWKGICEFFYKPDRPERGGECGARG